MPFVQSGAGATTSGASKVKQAALSGGRGVFLVLGLIIAGIGLAIASKYYEDGVPVACVGAFVFFIGACVPRATRCSRCSAKVEKFAQICPQCHSEFVPKQ